MWFVKEIFLGKESSKAHDQFVRFGRGDFKKRFVLKFSFSGDKLKINGSFENCNDLILKAAEVLGKIRLEGVILSKKEIEGIVGKKKASLYEFLVNKEFSFEELKKIYEKCYFMLLNSDSEIKIKCKKKLPRPKKSGEAKVDDSFIILEIPKKYFQMFKEEFFWDVPICKKAYISHEVIVNEIEVPKGAQSPEEMRLNAKRKGEIIREMQFDNQEKKEKIKFLL